MNAIWKSCYDFNWYAEQKNASAKRVVFVFLLLSVVLCGARLAMLGPETTKLLNDGYAFLRDEVPAFKITAGEVTVDGPARWSKEFEGNVGVVIDTTGGAAGLEKFMVGALLTKNQFLLKTGGGGIQTFDLKKVAEFDSRGPKVEAWAGKARSLVYPFLTPVLFLLSAAGLAIRWLATAAAGFLLAQGVGAALDWGQTARLAAFSLIPASYVILLGTLTPLHVVFLPSLVGMFILGVAVWTAGRGAESALGSGRSGPSELG